MAGAGSPPRAMGDADDPSVLAATADSPLHDASMKGRPHILGAPRVSKLRRSLSRDLIVDPVELQTQNRNISPRRVVSMDSVRSGAALLELAREHCQHFAVLAKGERELAPDRVVTIGTGCTGSAAEVLVFGAMEEAYRQYLPNITF